MPQGVLGIFCLSSAALLVVMVQVHGSHFKERYTFRATTPEMLHLNINGKLNGVDMMQKLSRRHCREITYEEMRYRTYDGTCNNGKIRGASFAPLKRNLPPSYTDGDSPRQFSHDRKRLPGARDISRKMHTPLSRSSDFTAMVMQFGQLLDHDISVVPVPTQQNTSIRCCGVPESVRFPDCFPIEIPEDDHHFKSCMEFVRSEPIRHQNGSIVLPRMHENAVTSYLDASFLYGSDSARAKSLRTRDGQGALLKTSYYKGRERLSKGNPKHCINREEEHYCALAGDDRVNEQPGLTVIHTIFSKEHNRLVRKLVETLLARYELPHSRNDVDQYLETAANSTQEKIFQIVRKVMGAVWQNIVYREYIPMIIGPARMTKYNLWTGQRSRFEPEIDPSIEVAFNTAAFRFGHTLVREMMYMDSEHPLMHLFSESEHALEHLEKIAFSLVSKLSCSDAYDRHMTTSLVDHLFENNRMNKSGLDLAALNIQRGRDHGLQPYNEYRKYFGLKPYVNWQQFGEGEQILKGIYRHPDDVDLFTGGLNEESVEHGIVGEVFAEIIGRQFHDLKFGDRYFFETNNTYFGFTDVELVSLTRLRMNKIFCENASLRFIQANPFKQPDFYNPIYNCSTLPDIDMSPWIHYF